MKPILIVAGGTGGHVYPALSFALQLIQDGQKVLFLTDRRGIAYLQQDVALLNPVVLPLDRKQSGILGLLKLLLQFIHSFIISLTYVSKARLVIGFSGFPTFATLVAGLMRGRPLYVHEQNAVLGKVNRWLAPFVTQIFTSTKTILKVPLKARAKIQFVGMPVRPEFAPLADRSYDMPVDTIRLLITGGSQGARSFSDVIPTALSLLPETLQKRLEVMHQVRPDDQAHAQKIYDSTHIKTVHLVPFVEDMAAALGNAHLSIMRSGASTLAELSAAGCPALMIPYPYATDNHQTYNALEVTRRGGGWLLSHQDFTAVNLEALLLDLLENPKKLLIASQHVKLGYIKSAIKKLVQSL